MIAANKNIGARVAKSIIENARDLEYFKYDYYAGRFTYTPEPISINALFSPQPNPAPIDPPAPIEPTTPEPPIDPIAALSKALTKFTDQEHLHRLEKAAFEAFFFTAYKNHPYIGNSYALATAQIESTAAIFSRMADNAIKTNTAKKILIAAAKRLDNAFCEGQRAATAIYAEHKNAKDLAGLNRLLIQYDNGEIEYDPKEQAISERISPTELKIKFRVPKSLGTVHPATSKIFSDIASLLPVNE